MDRAPVERVLMSREPVRPRVQQRDSDDAVAARAEIEQLVTGVPERGRDHPTLGRELRFEVSGGQPDRVRERRHGARSPTTLRFVT
jgi:hypothetical protein